LHLFAIRINIMGSLQFPLHRSSSPSWLAYDGWFITSRIIWIAICGLLLVCPLTSYSYVSFHSFLFSLKLIVYPSVGIYGLILNSLCWILYQISQIRSIRWRFLSVVRVDTDTVIRIIIEPDKTWLISDKRLVILGRDMH